MPLPALRIHGVGARIPRLRAALKGMASRGISSGVEIKPGHEQTWASKATRRPRLEATYIQLALENPNNREPDNLNLHSKRRGGPRDVQVALHMGPLVFGRRAADDSLMGSQRSIYP